MSSSTAYCSMSGKIKSGKALGRMISSLKASGKKIVFTNGCFDIIHVGHVDYLDKARRMGDLLVVGLNSDDSVKRIKGPSRPVNGESARAKVLSALIPVDFITIFGEDTPERLIKMLKPDILVKGGDWKAENIVGASFVKTYGGKVKVVPFVNGFSTTSVISRLGKRS